MSDKPKRKLLKDLTPGERWERRIRLRPAASEHALQVACIRWTMGPSAPPKARAMFAIPNGGWRGMALGARLKAEGVKAGVPDLFLPVPAGGFHGLFLEMKNGTSGRISDDQAEWHVALEKLGYQVTVARNLGEFCTVVTKYLGWRAK